MQLSSPQQLMLTEILLFHLIMHHAAEQLRQLLTRNLVRCFEYGYETRFAGCSVELNICFRFHSHRTVVGLRTSFVEPVNKCCPNGRARSALITLKG